MKIIGVLLDPTQLSDEVTWFNKDIIDIKLGAQQDPKVINIVAWFKELERKDYHMFMLIFGKGFSWIYNGMLRIDLEFVTLSLVV